MRHGISRFIASRLPWSILISLRSQIDIILREWYQHPNGQVPATKWKFSDANPPVIGWAAWRIYKIEEKQSGKEIAPFLKRFFINC
jgi:hypothetical protein